MEIGETITTVITALLSGGVGSLIGWGAKKRQEEAAAAKTETEVKGDQIENLEKMVEKAYKPIIEDLTRQIKNLQGKVEKLEGEKDTKNRRIDELEERVDELEDENRQLRIALRRVSPDSVPSLRGRNGKRAPRNQNGTFSKKEEQS
ncbi:MAG: hypothetical protein IKD95_04610 [Bacteroidales bacterium]|nr:hypothetical protein [Bacteroidales bacterium]